MRIGTKLLAAYLALIGVIALLAGVGLPRLVERSVIRAEQEHLQRQADALADTIGQRLTSRSVTGPRSAALALELVEELLTDYTVALVDSHGLVAIATRPELRGRVIATPCLQPLDRRWPSDRQLVEIKGMGYVILACSSLELRAPALKGLTLIMVRDMSYIQALAKPISRSLAAILILGLGAALVVSGWLSRDMVKRLKTTGVAARALADGDLAHRAPLQGNDEITELAGHFNHMAERIEALVAGLRRSEQARKDLLVMVSHELRTPITSISGFAEALRDGVVQGDERKQRYFQILAAESARLSRLINELFDMAKLDAGQVDLNLQAVSAASLLVEFAESFRPVAEGAGVRLELAVTEEAERARIYGDRDRLNQVLTNLASNAVRFSPEGDTVLLRASVLNDELRIEVTDRGPGLPREDAARVFERFYQGVNQGRGHKGAGLGLSIVKSLVTAHGGTVGVESRPGSGATFWFQLKRLEQS